jgi:hypothetical protein
MQFLAKRDEISKPAQIERVRAVMIIAMVRSIHQSLPG